MLYDASGPRSTALSDEESEEEIWEGGGIHTDETNSPQDEGWDEEGVGI